MFSKCEGLQLVIRIQQQEGVEVRSKFRFLELTLR